MDHKLKAITNNVSFSSNTVNKRSNRQSINSSNEIPVLFTTTKGANYLRKVNLKKPQQYDINSCDL